MTTDFPGATPDQLSVVQSAQDTGSAHLLDLTEDEYEAFGWPSPSRGDLARQGLRTSPAADGASSARAGLVARGLAEAKPGGFGSLTPAGALQVYLTLAVQPEASAGLVATYVHPEPQPTSRRVYRLTLLRKPFGGAVACVERLELPLPNDPAASLAISIDLLRYDRLVDLICGEAFRGPTSEAERRVARGVVTNVVLGQLLVPSKLTTEWSTDTAVLTSSRKSVLGSKTSNTVVSREQYAEHLQRRLLDIE